MGNIELNQIEIISDSQRIMDVLSKAVKDDERFRTWNVVVDSPHAEFVEYGTNPANPYNPGYNAFAESTLDRIREWVWRKFSDKRSDKECRDMAYAIYRRIMEKGITEKPFARPAISDLKSNKSILKVIFENGTGGTYGLAQYLVRLMQENIERNESIYDGELIDSIKIVPGDEASMPERSAKE